MEPTHYLRIFRRRWWLVAALGVIGMVLGLGSARFFSGGESDSNFYAATHTLIVNSVADGESPANAQTAPNFELIAFLARTGDVPEMVAEQLGGDAIRLSSRVALTPNPTLGTLEITATGTSPRETEELATTYALTLLDYLAQRQAEDNAARIAAHEARIATLDEQLQALDAEVQAGADPAIVESEKALIAQDRAAERRALATLQEAATSPAEFTTLNEAKAIELGPEEYAAALANIQTEDSEVLSARDAQIQAAQEASTASSGPGAVTRAGVGGILGVIAGIITVLVLDRFDTRLRTREDVEAAYGMPVLAEIPELSRAQLAPGDVVSWAHPRSRAAESFRVLRSALLFANVTQDSSTTNGSRDDNGAPAPPAADAPPTADGGKVVLVSSPGPSEGKTTLTANLSAVFAEAGYRVLALNCDYRRPKLHVQFGVEYEPRRVIATEVPGVSIIADVIDDANRINPAEAVAAQREVIEKAREMFDLIVLDTAPLLTTNDAADLLATVDMVVVAARGNRTTTEAGFRAAELLERRGARVVGAVLIDGETKQAGRYYYYRDGYYEDDYTNEARRAHGEAGAIDTHLGLVGDPAVVAEGGQGDET